MQSAICTNPPCLSNEEDSRDLFTRADSLMKGPPSNLNSALNLLLANLNSHGEDINFLWRLAEAYRLESLATDCKIMQKELIESGLHYAKKALNLDEKHGDANKWFAIMTGMRNDYLPLKEKVENAILFNKHLELALKAKPEDCHLHHLLGRFKYQVATLSWIERKLVAALFGALPDATYDDVLKDALKCEELANEPVPENKLMIAQCYLAKKEYYEGVKWLDKADIAFKNAPPNVVLIKELVGLQIKYKKYKL